MRGIQVIKSKGFTRKIPTLKKFPAGIFPILAALITGTQAFLIWFTTFPSADNLIESIAATFFLKSRLVFWYFPGQAHGGMLEFPIQTIVLALFSQNYLLAIFPRVLFAAISGYFLAKIYRLLRPNDNNIWFLFFLLLAPALLRDLWLIGGGYSLSWSLQLLAIYLSLSLSNPRKMLVVGFLISLSFYEQPSSLLLTMLFAPYLFNKGVIDKKSSFFLISGFLPIFGLAVFLRARVNDIVYNPVSFSPNFDRILGSLGLVSSGNNNPSILHNTLGYINGPELVPGWMRFLTGCAVVLVVLLPIIIRSRPEVHSLSFSFFLLLCGISILSMFINTGAWFYGLSGCVFIPLAMSIIYHELRSLILKSVFVIFMVINFLNVPSLLNGSTIFQVMESHAAVKAQYNELENFSKVLAEKRVQFIYGDYWTVYPIMLSSKNEVIAIPESFNRFKGIIRAKLEYGTKSIVAVSEDRIKEFVQGGSCELISMEPYQFRGTSWQLINCDNGAIEEINN